MPANGFETIRYKVRELNALRPDILCILFDDMRGDVSGLAQIQAKIADIAMVETSAARYAVCPTYYSDDPVLEEVFGPMSGDYISDFGVTIDKRIEIFWTGPKVISRHVSGDMLDTVSNRFRREPLLWDNSVSNDGAVSSCFLPLTKAATPGNLPHRAIKGRAVNPMLQPRLFAIPLLAAIRGKTDGVDIRGEVVEVCGPQIGSMIAEDVHLFADCGIREIEDGARLRLVQRYKNYSGSRFAAEVADWAEGRDAFDPSCLTS
jgi:hypothetical protein